MVNFYKTINEAFDKRYDSNTKKPLTEASAAHAHPDMSKKAGSISSMILSNKDRIDNATSLQDLRAVVEDILSPLEGNAKVTEINGRLRAMKDHVKALQYIYNIILKGDNLGTIKTGKAKERSKNESVRSRRVNESSKRFDWDNLDVFEQTKIMKDFVRKYNGTKVFEDFADYIGVPVDDVIDLFTDAESRGFIQIPQEKQINSAYASTDIYESVRSRRVNESKRKLKEANTDWYSMDWDDQVNAIKRFVKNYRGTKVFEDFAASVGVDVDDVIDIFADLESYGIIYIPRKIQIDDKYMNNDIYESKSKLKEAASGTFNPDREYDWYEDGDVHPFLDIFDNALDELGLWSEPSIQGGNGYDYFYTKDGDREAGGVDFGIESDFINNLFQEMKGHSWAEIEDAIAEFVENHVEYSDDYDEDDDDDEDEEENLYARSANQLLPKFKKYLNKEYDCDVRYESGEYYVYVTLKQRPSVHLCRLLASTLVLLVRDSGLDINDKSTSDKAWNDVFDKIINYTNARSGYNVIPFRSLEDLSIYKGKDCSYLSEVRPGEDLLTTYIFTYPIQNGSFKDYPYMMLLYDNTRRDYTVIGPNYRADYIYQGDAMDDLESKLKSAQANESFRRRRVNESARRSRTTKKKIR